MLSNGGRRRYGPQPVVRSIIYTKKNPVYPENEKARYLLTLGRGAIRLRKDRMAIRFLALIMSEGPSYIFNITGLGWTVNHFID